MGYSLYAALHRQVPPLGVFEHFRYYAHERKLPFAEPPRSGRDAFKLYDAVNDWTLLTCPYPGPFREHRAASLGLSKLYGSFGLFLWAYDGDYWAYEFFRGGLIEDRFCQDPRAARESGGEDLSDSAWRGRPAVLADHLRLDVESLKDYLIQRPEKEAARLDVKPRPSDRHTRFSESAILDFLAFLGVPFQDPAGMKPWRSFSL